MSRAGSQAEKMHATPLSSCLDLLSLHWLQEATQRVAGGDSWGRPPATTRSRQRQEEQAGEVRGHLLGSTRGGWAGAAHSWHSNPDSWPISEPQACSVAGPSFRQYQKMTASNSHRAQVWVALGVLDLRVLVPFLEHCLNSTFGSPWWALGSKHQVDIVQLFPGHTKLFKTVNCLPSLSDFLFRHPARVDGS